MSKDYYQILGVQKNASADEIKQSYRKLVHKYHPDKAGGDEQKIRELNEAYQVLKDPQKRSQYDQFGSTFEQARSQGGFSGFSGFGDFADFAQGFRGQGGTNFDLGDIFSEFFGGGTRTQTGVRRGSDIEVEVTIPFKEVVTGSQKTLTIDKNITCAVCKGEGNEPGSKQVTCATCKGGGQVMRTIGFGIGMRAACPDCQGRGKRPEKICKECRGSGTKRSSETVSVKIPAGIDDGQSIRIAGGGQAGEHGGLPGDLYVRIQVVPDKRFKRHGYDIHTQAEVSFAQAALGDKIEVETVQGLLSLKIPPGTQSHSQFRLGDKGVPELNGRGHGDHYVEVIVKTPTQLSSKQKKILEEFDRE